MAHSKTSFPKAVLTGSFDFGTDEPLVSIVDDFKGWRKTASNSSPVVAEWGDIKPIPGHSLIHLIALGDFEKYSSNSNGDAFMEAHNREHHPDFMKYGSLYRNHKIGDSRREGFIHKTAHNDEMGRVELIVAADVQKTADWLSKIENGEPVAFSMGYACVLPGQKVWTSRGLIPVESVLVGDQVIGLSGQRRAVTSSFANPRDNRKICSFKTCGSAEELVVTEDHPVYVVRRDKVRFPSGAPNRNPDWTWEEVEASTIKKGDYLVRPCRAITGDRDSGPGTDLAWIAGQYLGDGHMSGHIDEDDAGDSITITVHKEDEEIWRKLLDICMDKGWNFSFDNLAGEGRQTARKKQAVNVRIREKSVADFCSQYCGRLKGKRPSDAIFGWSRDEVLSFVGGYFDADGCGSCGNLRYSSVLDDLAYGISELLLSCGLPVATWKDWIGERTSGAFKTNKEYAIVGFVTGSQVGPLVPWSFRAKWAQENTTVKSPHTHHIKFSETESGNLVAFFPVKELSISEDGPDEVYCLEVEEDHNFVVSGVLVHNCSKDKCSICDEEFTGGPSSYCEHVRKKASYPYGLNRILPDGKKCYLTNVSGHWNDLSKVGIGADLIAFDLRKVASRTDDLSGADLGQMFWIKDAALRSDRVDLAIQLATLENRANLKTAWASKREVPDELIESFNLNDSPAEAFGWLANAGVILPLPQFIKVACGGNWRDLEEEANQAWNSLLQSGVMFGNLNDASRQRVASNLSWEGHPSPSPQATSVLREKVASDFSPSHPNFDSRLLSDMSNRLEYRKTASLTPSGEALVEQYLAYRLSAIAPNTASNPGFLADSVFCH